MTDRLHTITVRGRIALAACFFVVAVQMVLNSMGLAHYYFEMGPNFDRSIGDRVCNVLDWMILACLVVWGASEFRVRQSILFRETSSRVLPLLAGVLGLLVLLIASIRLVRIPLSGEAFGNSGWSFGVGWLLVWWYLVFRR
jgi:hypothetical protein